VRRTLQGRSGPPCFLTNTVSVVLCSRPTMRERRTLRRVREPGARGSRVGEPRRYPARHDGAFTRLNPVYRDLVVYEIERPGQSMPREEFVAGRIGHDLSRTRYEAVRRHLDDPRQATPPFATDAADRAAGF
jgi:hypothetical protein